MQYFNFLYIMTQVGYTVRDKSYSSWERVKHFLEKQREGI
jgi:hypothetical protein